ncbi:unnamed protein product [Ceutorhynchus assimilis]|uniref:Activating transcription factor 7-interacting protein Fn3 domain-containing protein n=1 Tax=Ceutorhynchus assimilis TaxID=467358 RepID=A0A9N9MWB6_9CUCU|nr:unnamed protein product [Ceutorhynchus assimilis]
MDIDEIEKDISNKITTEADLLNISMVCGIDEDNAAFEKSIDEASNDGEEKSDEEETIENESLVIQPYIRMNRRNCRRSPPVVNNENVKKPKLINLPPNNDEASSSKTLPNLKTLSSFSNFMQFPKMAEKLTRSDLEEIVLQKVCQALVLNSPRAELFQSIQKKDQNLELLQKQVEELQIQCSNLTIISQKLEAELQTQKRNNGIGQPLVPLKITRNVGLQAMLHQEEAPKMRQQLMTPGPDIVKKKMPAPICIDLTDNDEDMRQMPVSTTTVSSIISNAEFRARKPTIAPTQPLKFPLPKPIITLRKLDMGVVLQWEMPYKLDSFETIGSYQIWACQAPNPLPWRMWKKVSVVQSLPLPMACNLSQFQTEKKFYFAVCAVDVHQRSGELSDAKEIYL